MFSEFYWESLDHPAMSLRNAISKDWGRWWHRAQSGGRRNRSRPSLGRRWSRKSIHRKVRHQIKTYLNTGALPRIKRKRTSWDDF